jgi:hypothetical protein
MFSISNDETDVRELIVPCYIIEHEKGRLLWDGGLPSSVADHEGYQKKGPDTFYYRNLSKLS